MIHDSHRGEVSERHGGRENDPWTIGEKGRENKRDTFEAFLYLEVHVHRCRLSVGISV